LLQYRLGRDNAKAADASRRASDAHYQAGNLHLSARAMEARGALHLKDGDTAGALTAYRAAADLFREHGQPEKAAEMLGKAAQAIGTDDPAAAMTLYEDACALYVEEGKEIYAGDTFKRGIALMVKAREWERACELLERHAAVYEGIDSRPSMYKCFLSVIVLRLQEGGGGYERADRDMHRFMEKEGFFGSMEGRLANQMLDAWERGDAEAVEETVKGQGFTFLDVNIAKLAKALRHSGEAAEQSIL
jgi:tetratricopeptide (TPR) repeat protein